MVRTGVMRAYGSQLRHWVGVAMTNRFAHGRRRHGHQPAAAILQRHRAATSSFVTRGMVGAASALAIMLGADLGTSLVTQAYSLPIYILSPVLILVGYIMFNKLESTRLRDLGRAGIGLGLVLLALHLITRIRGADPRYAAAAADPQPDVQLSRSSASSPAAFSPSSAPPRSRWCC